MVIPLPSSYESKAAHGQLTMDTDMRLLFTAIICSATLSVLPARAQVITEPLVDDQYHIVQIADGVLRIDRQSGEITECRDDGNGWVCRLSADDRQAYEAEINRLDLEISRLEGQVSRLQGTLNALRDPDSSDTETSVRERMDLPTEDELDAVMDTAEEAMRRFFGIVQDLRDEMENDSQVQ
jgi:hypothetical protein